MTTDWVRIVARYHKANDAALALHARRPDGRCDANCDGPAWPCATWTALTTIAGRCPAVPEETRG